MKNITTLIKLSLFALAVIIPQISSGQVIVSSEGTYVNSGTNGINTNLSGEDRALIGFHEAGTLRNMRGVFQFDLSSVTGTITSVSLTLTQQGFTAGDQDEGQLDLELKNLGESFDETTVTWSTLTPNGGDISGNILSTVAGYDASSISTAVFASSVDFVNTAQSAADGSNLLSLIIYSPAAEAINTGGFSNQKSFYRFNETATLNVTTAPIPEPGTYALLAFGFCALLLLRRVRSR